MIPIVLLFICICIGITLRQLRIVPPDAYIVLNSLLVNVFLPALILVNITATHFDSRFILPILTPWVQYGVGFIFFIYCAKLFDLDRGTLAALIMTGGISSTSFVAFPVFESLYGKEGLEIGILMSQSGSFLVCMTLGIATASWFASSEPSISGIIKNIFRFPPFIAFIIAIFINILKIPLSETILEVLRALGRPFQLIALLSVGLQIDFENLNLKSKSLNLGLFFKLIIAPALFYVIYHSILGKRSMDAELSVMGAAIGPMNTAAIIASRFNLNPNLATQMVGIGIPLSFIIVYLIHWIWI